MNGGQKLENLKKYVRAANYLTVAQIFLQGNFLLEKPLSFDDIKPRLLGHWGSCPGVNHVYAHLLRVSQKPSALNTAFILGPGHAFPALQSNLFLEDTLADFDQKATRNKKGIEYIARNFSWAGGFPSHASPFTPGVVLEGGELGYSLSTAFGVALDNSELVVATLIGDGEAETGPIAAAWHLNKLIDPVKNGVVLPILHLNEYKISGPTIFGSMSDFELIQYFHGSGWQPKIVDEYAARDFDFELAKAFDEVYTEIEKIKKGTKNYSGENGNFVRLPMLIVRSKKGDSGPKIVEGEKIEGNSASHQVPLPEAKTNKKQLGQLETWLKSYNFGELFDRFSGEFKPWLSDFLPEKKKLLGQAKQIYGGDIYSPLQLPGLKNHDTNKSLAMNALGEYLENVFMQNLQTFRFFSPDETYSNKLNAIFGQVSRSWQRRINPWEKDLAPDGRVTEILSEHSLQGLLQGYILTGRHGTLTSYEAFAPIISSMMDQYAKFLAQSQQVPWRKPIASLNYILTSTGWRQDHNGFSHQNPSFIDEILRRQNSIGQVFLPADDNSALVAIDKMLASTDNVNALVAGKTPEPRFFDLETAQRQLENNGVFSKDLFDDGDNPDIIIASAGDYVTKEAVAALQVLQSDMPDLKLRFVNILALSSAKSGGRIGPIHSQLSQDEFNQVFTKNTPVVFNFHGYPQTIRAIVAEYAGYNSELFNIGGYIEQGSTTTPFDMLARNKVSRYDITTKVAEIFNRFDLSEEYQNRLKNIKDYAYKNGVDPDEIESWQYLKFY